MAHSLVWPFLGCRDEESVRDGGNGSLGLFEEESQEVRIGVEQCEASVDRNG